MSLEILHNRAEHTHENEQFRRVAIELRSVFIQKNWEGILIGNPFNDLAGLAILNTGLFTKPL